MIRASLRFISSRLICHTASFPNLQALRWETNSFQLHILDSNSQLTLALDQILEDIISHWEHPVLELQIVI